MQITDAELLQWLDDGSLIVPLDCPERIEVFGRTVTAFLIGRKQTPRYGFSLRRNGRRRTIRRAKLVWLSGARRLIPDGFEIHHKDENRLNDEWSNLICIYGDDHRKLHEVDELADAMEFLNS